MPAPTQTISTRVPKDAIEKIEAVAHHRYVQSNGNAGGMTKEGIGAYLHWLIDRDMRALVEEYKAKRDWSADELRALMTKLKVEG